MKKNISFFLWVFNKNERGKVPRHHINFLHAYPHVTQAEATLTEPVILQGPTRVRDRVHLVYGSSGPEAKQREDGES